MQGSFTCRSLLFERASLLDGSWKIRGLWNGDSIQCFNCPILRSEPRTLILLKPSRSIISMQHQRRSIAFVETLFPLLGFVSLVVPGLFGCRLSAVEAINRASLSLENPRRCCRSRLPVQKQLSFSQDTSRYWKVQWRLAGCAGSFLASLVGSRSFLEFSVHCKMKGRYDQGPRVR